MYSYRLCGSVILLRSDVSNALNDIERVSTVVFSRYGLLEATAVRLPEFGMKKEEIMVISAGLEPFIDNYRLTACRVVPGSSIVSSS